MYKNIVLQTEIYLFVAMVLIVPLPLSGKLATNKWSRDACDLRGRLIEYVDFVSELKPKYGF